MTICVIIVTFNGAKWIDKCFGSLLNSSISLEILAIDNCSTDNTPDLIKKKFPIVKVIQNKRNLGFGQANNIGLKYVLENKIDYAFLLNQDAWIENNTIADLIEISVKNPQFGIISPAPYDGDGQEYDYIYSECYEANIDRTQEFHNSTYTIDFINAAAWLIPQNTIKIIGGFHPIFLMYGEDVNYVHRLKNYSNLKVGVSLNVKYFHDRKDRKDRVLTKEQKLNKQIVKNKVFLLNPGTSLLRGIRLQARLHLGNIIKSNEKSYWLSSYKSSLGFTAKIFFLNQRIAFCKL